MESVIMFLIILIIIISLGFFIFLFFFFKKNALEKAKEENKMEKLERYINSLKEALEKKLEESQKFTHQSVQNQLKSSQELIHKINDQVSRQLIDVTKQISETKEMNKQVFQLAQQLSDLERVLKNQKTRGNLGEMGLELILSNILPPNTYKLQYQFSDGKIVDAVIFTHEGKIIPIDAKFSLENYQRLIQEKDKIKKKEIEKMFQNDLKKRIEETSQYIRPEENTLPFAFMFIPAEGIYYDLITSAVGSGASTRSLLEYAQNEKKVIVVSPTTFSAYLQSVLYGFKAFQIEKRAVEIQKNVEKLGRHLKSYEEAFLKLGKTLTTAQNHYENASHHFRQLDKDIYRITGKEYEFITLPPKKK